MSRFSLFTAVLSVLLVEVGILGAHTGAIAPKAGFAVFLSGFAVAILALLLGLSSLAYASASGRARRRREAATGIVLALLICMPIGFTIWHWLSMPYPAITDITTDCANPPRFVNAPGLSAASMKYDRARLEPIQNKYYPKLGPLELDEAPADAFAAVRAAANVPPLPGTQVAEQIPSAPGWFITYIDPATRTIEGVDSSYLFRFRDDFVIQVRAGAEPNTSSIEMRSRSRDGIRDLGANYDRIREFFGMLRAMAIPSKRRPM